METLLLKDEDEDEIYLAALPKAPNNDMNNGSNGNKNDNSSAPKHRRTNYSHHIQYYAPRNIILSFKVHPILTLNVLLLNSIDAVIITHDKIEADEMQ